MTSKIRVHQPGRDKRLDSRKPLCRDFISHLFEIIHSFLAYDTVYDSFRHLGPRPRVGLELKSKDILFFHLFKKKSFVFE